MAMLNVAKRTALLNINNVSNLPFYRTAFGYYDCAICEDCAMNAFQVGDEPSKMRRFLNRARRFALDRFLRCRAWNAAVPKGSYLYDIKLTIQPSNRMAVRHPCVPYMRQSHLFRARHSQKVDALQQILGVLEFLYVQIIFHK
jgi:hypothetical protein